MKLFVKSILFIVRRLIENKFFKKKYIVSRAACLVNDSYGLLSNCNYRINFQKSRVDVLNINFSKRIKPKIIDVRYVQDFLYSVYLEQYFDFWKNISKTDFFIMDSYSELTDQLFVNYKSENLFCSNYSDVDEKALNYYKCEGLIEKKSIEKEYEIFFKNLRFLNKNIKIIYVFFPIINENRDKFIDQHFAISKAIDNLQEIFNLNVIRIPKKVLKKNKIGEFPYHYNKEVYDFLSNYLNKILKSQ